MKFRSQVIFFGGILFFGSIWLMIGQLDTGNSPQKVKFSDGSENDQVRTLQDKLSLVERELLENRKIMHKVKESLQDMEPVNNVHVPMQREEIRNNIENENDNKPVLPLIMPKQFANDSRMSDTCPVLSYSGGKSDVNMINVYDHLPFNDPDGGVWKQGWDIQTSDQEWTGRKLKVFIVPHSHNDPGWLKTVERYFSDQTQHILNNIVDALSQDPARRFIWAEMSYLSMWWDIATPDRKQKMQTLVKNGQLEIVTGGWVMNDEANTHYFAMIDQLIEGMEWLRRTLNVVPKSGWAIDPFGHTPTMAYILKQMKFKNMLIQRVHYAVKKYLAQEKSLEFRWRQMWDSASSTDMMCHLMPFYSYDVPHTCGPDPKICCQFDFARLPGGKLNCPWKVPPVAITDSNVETRAKILLDQYRKKSKLFKSDTLLIILGDDFRYSLAKETNDQFDNYARIISYVNSHPELNAKFQFGTLSEYFDAMKTEVGGEEKLPALSGDFFTYADREDHYWSGYYTSRPYHKMQERVLESHLRGAEMLFALSWPKIQWTGLGETFSHELYPLLVQARQNLGLFQHHDGITGTAKDHVVIDYGNKLMKSVMDAKKVISYSAQVLLQDMITFDPNVMILNYDEVYQAQNQQPAPVVVKLPTKNQEARKVVLYNSLDYDRTGVVRLIVTSPDVVVMSENKNVIPSQTSPIWSDSMEIRTDQFELVFLSTVPAIGLAVYKIWEDNDVADTTHSTVKFINPRAGFSKRTRSKFVLDVEDGGEFTIMNDQLVAHFSGQNGMLQSVTTVRDNVKTQLGIEFVAYTSRNMKDKSGAYLFLPAGPAQPHVTESHRPIVRIIRGPVMSTVHVLLPNVLHKVTLYTGTGAGTQSLGVHVSNDVDVRIGYDNKELSMRLNSDVSSGSKFFTDLNGFQIQPRTTYSKLPLQANFYPIPTMAFIQDEKSRITLMTAQPLGVASLKSGQIEVILDRRLMQDDNRGVGQGVKDNLPTPENFVIMLERWTTTGLKESKSSAKLAYPSMAVYQSSWELLHPVWPMSVNEQVYLKVDYRSLPQPLPCDVHVLNLRAIHSKDAVAPTDQSALLLHTVGRECSLDADKYFHPTCLMHGVEKLAVTISTLFTNSGMRKTSLSLQHDGSLLDNQGGITVSPMEIQAYKIVLT
ncbi:alpha-mannosidase 2 [Ciona intestinalis]